MVEVTSGHLGMGNWRFKEIDGVTVFTLIQAFNRHDEYRIGPNQVVNYEIEQTLENKLKIKMNLSDDRYCRAFISHEHLHHLDNMVKTDQTAPAAKQQNDVWIHGLMVFLVGCCIYEFLK